MRLRRIRRLTHRAAEPKPLPTEFELRKKIAKQYRKAFFSRSRRDALILGVQKKRRTFEAIAMIGNEMRSILLPEGDYRRPLFPDTYSRNEKKRTSEHKLCANKNFFLLCEEYPRPHRNFVFLETPNGETVKSLYHRNIEYENIYIPNPDSEFERHCAQVVKDLGAHIHTCTVYEFFRDLPPTNTKQYDLALDYCCTYQGCPTSCLWKLDLELILGLNKFPRHNGILWITLCLRQSKEEQRIQYMTLIPEEVVKLGKMYNYQLEVKETDKYQNMCRFLFRSVRMSKDCKNPIGCLS
jgi:hypothetical protein